MSDRILHGVGVSPGVACAQAITVRWSFPDIPNRAVLPGEQDAEIARLHAAVDATAEQLIALRERTILRAGPEEAGIFDAQILMVRDVDFLSSVEFLIRGSNLAAETAYEFRALELRNEWQASRKSFLRDRLADLNAIQLRTLAHLLHRPTDDAWLGEITEQVVLVVRELSPGLTVQLDRDHVVGFITEEGTRTSHAAILAHSLGIPAVMGVSGALNAIQDGMTVLLDGHTGTVILDPSPVELELAAVQRSRRHKLEMQLEGIAGEPAITPDGTQILLQANVDLPEEIEAALHHGAQGVGLLRTEFLITGRATLPSEDEQTEYYRRVGAAFAGHPVVIRTFDLGGDKIPAAFDAPQEANPFLGWRSIRVCLDEPSIFRPQLRAILRAAADRALSIMLPMVISLDEVAQTRTLLAEEAEHLRLEGVRAASDVPIGLMIETPAAVVLAEEFAHVAAFLSVGSNDLTQYTLAVDRGNARMAAHFDSLHPAVVRQLCAVRTAAAHAGIPAGVCGEMASDPFSAVLLLGLGFDRLSIGSPSIPLVKWVVRHVPVSAARAAADAAVRATSTAEVKAILRETLGNFLDLRLVDPVSALQRTSVATSLPRFS